MAQQSKRLSLIEVWTSITLGWLTAILLNRYAFPYYEINIPWDVNFKMSIVFTFAALIRGYGVRRFFNWLSIILDEKDNRKRINK